MTFHGSNLCRTEVSNWLGKWLALGGGAGPSIPILLLQLEWGWGADVNSFTGSFFFSAKGIPFSNPQDDAWQGNGDSDFSRLWLLSFASQFVLTTLHLWVPCFPEYLPWQPQFPVATVLLQYFLGICIFFFFFTSMLKIPVGVKGNWIGAQPTLQSTIFCGKTWFVSQFSGCTQVSESDNKQERRRSFSCYSFEGGLSFIT